MIRKSLPLKTPVYIKYFFILGNVILTAFLMIYLRSIINPLLLAFVFAVLLTPICAEFERAGVPRLLSAILSILILIIFIVLLSSFIYFQFNKIASEWDQIQANINQLLSTGQKATAGILGLKLNELRVYGRESINYFLQGGLSFFNNIVAELLRFLTASLLFFLSLFFFLFYRHFFLTFIYKMFSSEKHEKVTEATEGIEAAVKKYTLGLLLVTLIMAVLNSTGLTLLGLQHAVFFGMLGAVLTIIPYVGIMIGSILPALYALTTTNSFWYPVGVILVFSFVQFLEGNFITPNIVGNIVNINGFVALLSLFVGVMLLGPVGLILAIPLLGITKIICDSVKSLRPVGFVIGIPQSEKKNVRKSKKTLWEFLFGKN